MTAPIGTPLFGTADGETLTGTDGTDIIEGLGGDDVINGGAGEDVASYIDAPGSVTVVLGAFALGNADGAAGHDLLLNIEDIYGSQFDDVLTGDDDTGNYLAGFGGNDTISGNGGNDRLYGGNGNDSISGGTGDDYMEGGSGNDTIDGGTGNNDTVGFSGKLSDYTVTYDSATGIYTITDKTANRDGTDQVSHVQSFKFSDTTVSASQLLTLANDKTPPTLTTVTPNNAAVAVPVTQDIVLTFSEAIALGAGSILLKDADGNVLATYTASSTANLTVSGSTLTLHFSAPLAAGSNYSLVLGAGSVHDLAGNDFAGSLGYHFTTAGTGQTLIGTATAPNVTGGAGDDTLIAGPGNGTLDGGAGNDVLMGGPGNSLMLGGAGNDTLISTTGADTMQGGDGADLYYVNNAGDVVIETAANLPEQPGHGPDADLGRSVDKVIASISYTLTSFVENLSVASGSGGMAATGNDLNNVLTGNEANNLLNGKAGNDTIDGGAGTDTAQYTGKYADYKVTLGGAANATTVTDSQAGRDGADSLTNVERLQFSDVKLAMDVGATQAAGETILMMAATLGSGFPANQQFAGIFLGYFDSPGATALGGASLLIDATGIMAAVAQAIFNDSSNASIIKTIYLNVNGTLPDANTLADLLAPVTAHTSTLAQVMADMAMSSVNQTHVNLAGFAGTGLQYV